MNAGTKCRRAVQLRVGHGRSETGCAPATDLPLSRTVMDRNRRAPATASYGRYLWLGRQPPTRNAGLGTRPESARRTAGQIPSLELEGTAGPVSSRSRIVIKPSSEVKTRPVQT